LVSAALGTRIANKSLEFSKNYFKLRKLTLTKLEIWGRAQREAARCRKSDWGRQLRG